MMIFKSEKGLSIIEIVVAMGLLGMVSLGVMKVTQNAQQTSTKMSHDFDFNQALTQINRYMADKDAATDFLQGVDISSINTSRISICDRTLYQDPSLAASQRVIMLERGTPMFSTSGSESDYPYQVLDQNNCMFIQRADPAITLNQPDNQVKISVTVILERLTPDKIGQGQKGAEFEMTVGLNASNQIVYAWGSDDDAAKIMCNTFGGNYISGTCYDANIQQTSATSNSVRTGELCIRSDCRTTWYNVVQYNSGSCSETTEGVTPSTQSSTPSWSSFCPQGRLPVRIGITARDRSGQYNNGGLLDVGVRLLCCDVAPAWQ